MKSHEEKKYLYRILAQTEGMTITGETKEEVTEAEAIADVKTTFLHEKVVEAGGYRNFVTIPICTKEEWRLGNVNFCPRCGKRLEDVEDNYFNGECFECGADLDISINVVVSV
ncbi:hypothetical protein [Brevibacillus reuszeri]|uniref:hypothetical protein n=1 Tax=Brevibacillus reuszeri TaxID=54915 RepID=UPI000CCC87FC|nr:hypothetical protein [Brevibacillus reuszeri]